MTHKFLATLAGKRFVAENTMEMSFLVSDPTFSFKAGQYVSLEVPVVPGGSVLDQYHDFSIASSPQEPQKFSIVFRVSGSLFKTTLLGLSFGASINVDGPKGILALPLSSQTPVVFVAGGVGISPFLSMMRHATETHSSQSITLIYCNTKEATAAYRDEIANLAKQNDHITYIESWGIPDKNLFAPYVAKLPDALWYVVGAPAMVEHTQQILIESGIMDTQIRIEEFSGY